MSDATYRLLYAGLGSALVAVIGFTIAFSPSGDESTLPEVVERIFPLPNDAVIGQTAIEIDMAVGYQIVLFVDGFRIAPAEIGVQTGTNRFSWQPAPGRFLESWEPGTHEIRLEWDRAVGIPDPGEYRWTFRVQ